MKEKEYVWLAEETSELYVSIMSDPKFLMWPVISNDESSIVIVRACKESEPSIIKGGQYIYLGEL